MTLNETVRLLSLIQVYYPKFADGRDIEVTAKAWQMVFADDNYELAQKAVLAYVATDVKGFPPMPGAIKEHMTPKINEMSAMEAWHMVRKAAENGWYHSQEEFDKLPPLVQRIVGSPGTLKDWSIMDLADLESVVGSNFQRNYKQLAQDHRDYQKLPQSVVQALPGFDKLGLMPGEVS